ncbi:DUF1003 domain-containing protein [Novilysobacter antarcticus]|uniref:DUF1003 domain-containing protein n=1 Tax=Novilysobacter antarcticus TaxID=2862543 RepID=UPI001C998572|nr:DUF1003 domain-containing protein [Lysobacter antarcticus]
MTHPKALDYLGSASRWFGRHASELDATTHRVLTLASRRQIAVEDPNRRLEAQTSYGERLADQVASFGGSWRFIIIFAAALVVWVFTNSGILGKDAFDPYPYIFLNLILSMVAAIQAPVIMMSQNRQASKDRLMAGYDYEVNLKAEVEILALHEKMDALRAEQMMTVISQQQTQIELLTRLVAERGLAGPEMPN